MQFLFVGSNVCLQLPSDSASRRTPLLLANTSYCKAYSGLEPYSVIYMPDAQNKQVSIPAAQSNVGAPVACALQ